MRSQQGPAPVRIFFSMIIMIGPKKDQTEINERGGFLATHPKLDFGHTFAHEGLDWRRRSLLRAARGGRVA
jgi:hypothetical protein